MGVGGPKRIPACRDIQENHAGNTSTCQLGTLRNDWEAAVRATLVELHCGFQFAYCDLAVNRAGKLILKGPRKPLRFWPLSKLVDIVTACKRDLSERGSYL